VGQAIVFRGLPVRRRQKAIVCATLPAAHELYDLKLGAGAEDRFGPEGLLDNATVEFHGDARGVQLQLAQEAKEGLIFGSRLGPAIHYDVDGHAWLTPLFYNNYSQI